MYPTHPSDPSSIGSPIGTFVPHHRSMKRGLNGDHTLHRLEELYGSHHAFILLSAITHLFRGVAVQNYPHTDEHSGTPTGWMVVARMQGLTYFLALSSLSLSAKNVRITRTVYRVPCAVYRVVCIMFRRLTD